jgi:hypothetical protein
VAAAHGRHIHDSRARSSGRERSGTARLKDRCVREQASDVEDVAGARGRHILDSPAHAIVYPRTLAVPRV